MESPQEGAENKEYHVGDATEILTRYQQVAIWIIEKTSHAKDIVTSGWHSFEEGDRDHFYGGPRNQR